MKELLVICKLVRMSVFGTEEDILAGIGQSAIGPCSNPSCSGNGINWRKVFSDAGVNGVSAICYEAVKRLPPEYQPDFNLMVRWEMSSQYIREGYRHRHDVTRELHVLLGKYDMDMLLLKGETLADNYPRPDLRESGDVDFVALPDYDAANSLFRSLGFELKFRKKHSSFSYKGVYFENHILEHTGGYNRAHHRTMSLLREALPNAVRRDDGCLELDPVTQTVFVVKHTAQHLCYSGGRIALRMLLDLALLLRRYPEIPDKWEPKLKQVGLKRFADVLLCAMDSLLGPDAYRCPALGSSVLHDGAAPSGAGLSHDIRVLGIRSHRTERRARRFIRLFTRLFLTDSNRFVRYFAKFVFLPLRPTEVLHIWLKRVKRLRHIRSDAAL